MSNKSRRWWGVTALCIMILMINIDSTAVNLALAQIAKEFNSKLSTIQWIINGYLLAAAAFMVIGGRLGDLFGRRRLFLISTGIFTAASLIAAIAPSIEILIFARFLQGLAMAIIFPQTIVLIAANFPLEQKALAVSISASTAGFSQAIGPTFGGFLLHYFGWRWIFLVNLPLGIITIVLARWALSKKCDELHPGKIDYWGTGILAITLFLFIYALNEMNYWHPGSLIFLSAIAVSFILFLIFVFIENRSTYPLVSLKLFHNPIVSLILLERFIITYGFGVAFFILSLYFQNILYFSAVHAGVLFLALTLIFGIVSPFAGKLIDRIGERIPLAISMASLTLAFTLLALANVDSHDAEFILPLALIGIGWAFGVPPLSSAIIRISPRDQTSVATGILYTIAYVGWAVGVALSGYILVALGKHYFLNTVQQTNINLSAHQQTLANGIYSGAQAAKNLIAPENNLSTQVITYARQAFMHAYSIAMGLTAFLHLLGLIVSFFIKRVSYK